MMMTEDWKPIANYEGLYEVSNLGRVRSFHWTTPRVMVGRIDRYGYHNVLLSKDGFERVHKVHRLVCEAFLGIPVDPSLQAAHLDGNPLNNASINLVWATQKENEYHKVLQGRRRGGLPRQGRTASKISTERALSIRELAKAGQSHRMIAKQFGISQPYCTRIINGARGPKQGIAQPQSTQS